jgi:biopolymer transport protein ExbD
MLRYRQRHQLLSGAAGRINMTPMIDVTFLLLTFFMLASHFASAERTDIELPSPDENQSVHRKFREKVIVNVQYTEPTGEPAYMLGALPVATLDNLELRLAQLAEQSPDLEVILRADRRLDYSRVREVMRAISNLQFTRMQVVTELEERP